MGTKDSTNKVRPLTDAELAKEMLESWRPSTLLAIVAETVGLCYVYNFTSGHALVRWIIILTIALNVIGLLAGPKMRRIKYRKFTIAVAQVKAIKAMSDEPNLDFTGPNVDEASFRLGYAMRGNAVAKQLAKVELLGVGIVGE